MWLQRVWRIICKNVSQVSSVVHEPRLCFLVRVIFLHVKPRVAGGSPIPKCRLSGSAIMFMWHNLYWYTGEGKISTFLFLTDPVFLNTRLAYDFFACICRKYINILRGSKFKGRHPHPRNTYMYETWEHLDPPGKPFLIKRWMQEKTNIEKPFFLKILELLK